MLEIVCLTLWFIIIIFQGVAWILYRENIIKKDSVFMVIFWIGCIFSIFVLTIVLIIEISEFVR